MDAVIVLLEHLKKEPRVKHHFLGLLHVLIGRRIATADGQLVSGGVTWRDLAAKLKKVRWDPDAVIELGLVPKALPPRDRQRYWYQAISRASIESQEALASAAELADVLRELGYELGPAPGTGSQAEAGRLDSQIDS